MKAAVLLKPKELVIKELPVPKYSDDEVLIKIKEVGLCGSDIHYYNTGRIGDFVVTKPIILGHESSGEIVGVGKNVKGFKVGDRVSIEPGIPCYKCNYCKTGRYNLCESTAFLATPPHDGAFVEYIKYDPNFVFKVSDDMSFTEAAMAEPMSVGYNTTMRLGIKPGDSVCILGSGPIGIACLELSRIAGATRIFISDMNDYRLKIAKTHGASETINVNRENLIEIVKRNTNGEGVDCSIEASGAEQALIQSINVVKRGGNIAWVGLGKDMVQIPYSDILGKDISIEAIFRYVNSYKPVVELLEARRINFDGFISHRFKLEEINKAINLANNPNVDKMKIIIYM